MMKLFLTPVDVWLFRDGRPFDAGSDHRARSLFPPHPSVMQGVIRSHHLVVKGVDLSSKKAIEEAVGTADDCRNLLMRGPLIAHRAPNGKLTRYFPAPADAAPINDSQLKPIQPRPPAHKRVVTSLDRQVPMVLFPHDLEPKKRELGGWLTEDQLFKCLQGGEAKPVAAKDLFTIEHRYGIGMDSDRRSTREGLLYAADFIRTCDGVGLYIEVDGYDGWPDSGVMRIGGEGRGARFEQIEAPPWPAPPTPLPQRFKLYFAGPTYFTGGWQPESWSKFFDGDVRLQAVAINRYESRGGFDWANGSQKPARRFVPAGSVYFFKCEGQARLKPDLINRAITDFGAEVGYGQFIIVEWKE